jgi:hypothetical protein
MQVIQLTALILILNAGMHSFFYGQTNLVTYAGNGGRETFYDVMQLTDGTFLVSGYADNLDWLGNVPLVELDYPGDIPNALGSDRYGILMHLSSDLQTIQQVVHFPQGAVEDIRFVKTNAQPYSPTGDLYISCNTSDTDDNDGGYIIGKLNHNFISGVPSALVWLKVVWARQGPKDYHPWDVTSDGRVYYISGEAHGYDWSALYCLDQTGERMPVENWRTHWLSNGTEWKGVPASANPLGSIDEVNYSGIVLKVTGRCELRSWTEEEFEEVNDDGNGGTRKGKWPADFLFDAPCDVSSPDANGPGYNGYSSASGSPVWGGSCICIDRRDNHMYLGMNFKSYYHPMETPDFEPAVIAFDDNGEMLWWSRLYHEVTPEGDTTGSIPDQYVDALAIDYANDHLVVVGRAHGNFDENLWEGNHINSNPSAYGFQNQFTGSNGNIHESWLGKLRLEDGVLRHSTYVAELAEGTGGLGTPHPDPNLNGWPDPNTGWPDVNTTRLAKNNMKITSSGDVVIAGVGRRTLTTANAYQQMLSPYSSGQGAWNSFVRVYNNELNLPKYSSLVVGEWDTLTQAGGGNTELFGVYKTSQGVICVGRQIADTSDIAMGNDIPVNAVPAWGSSVSSNESAILVYYTAANLFDPDDAITGVFNRADQMSAFMVYPNPGDGNLLVEFESAPSAGLLRCLIFDVAGQLVHRGSYQHGQRISTDLPDGFYTIILSDDTSQYHSSFSVVR